MSQSAAVSPATGAPTEREEWRRGGRTALFAALGYGTGPVLFLTTASVFVKPAMEATGWSTTQVLISPMLSVLFQLFGPLVGRLADRRGVKLTLTLGLIPYVVLLVLFATMPLNLVVYWGLGILMGFFGAYGFAIAWNRAVAVWFDKGAGKAFGVVGAGGAAAPILVIPLVTYVIYNAGWRTGYFVLAALTLLISLPAALFGLRTPPSETAQSTAKAQSGRKGKNATVARALKSARFWMLGLSMMVVTGAANAFLANMQPILLDGGLEVAVATSITTLFTAGVIVGRLGAGALLDLISRYWVAIGVFVLSGLGALTLVNVSLFPVAVVGAAALLVAFSQGAEADIVAYFMLKEYGKENFGTLYAWCFLLAGVGSLIMPYLFGGVRDLTGSYAGAVVVGCGCYLLGAVFIVANWVLARREQARPGSELSPPTRSGPRCGQPAQGIEEWRFMPKITFIDPDGTERTVEAVEGVSVMQNAVNNDIPGIIAECGGEMNCATCHVYVEDEWASKLPEKSWDENDMLDVVDNPQPNSRLSCQLTVTPELDGLRVKVAGQTSLL